MNYDCIIIGGGLSGLTCGIRCANEGLRTIIISSGMNALHFSSGSIDLLGYDERKNIVTDPFAYLEKFIKLNPEHPYAKIGVQIIRESLNFFREQVGIEKLQLYSNGELNHFHFTIVGTKKPTFLSQQSVFNERLKQAFERNAKIAVLNFEGFRDYYAKLTVERLRQQSLLKKTEVTVGFIKLPYYTRTEKNPHEFRSIDLARIFETERYLPRIAEEIRTNAGDAEIVSLPAFIGIHNFNQIHRRLEQLTGKLIYEAPCLPPSILGMRIDNALRSRYAALNGIYSTGDRVVGGKIAGGSVEHILLQNSTDLPLTARFYVLSTGSFFSGGLLAGFNSLDEPVFRLKLYGESQRNKWYSPEFFDKASHPFLEYGVETNKDLQPFADNGTQLTNLFCTGAILSRYNPVREATGSGVAIASGYFSANKIIQEIKKR